MAHESLSRPAASRTGGPSDAASRNDGAVQRGDGPVCGPGRWRRRTVPGPMVFALLWGAATASGQDRQPSPPRSDALLQQQRAIDDRLRQERMSVAPLDALVDWQWGGWIDYFVFHFQDGIQSQRVMQRPGLSLWTRLRVDDGAHEVFARMRLTFEYFNPADSYRRQQDWIGPNLDRGWYQIDVGKAFRLTQPADPLQLKVRIGRQDTRLGTGYAFDLPTDAVVAEGKVFDFAVTGVFAKSIASYPNIDRSEAVDSHMARRFFGVQVAYEGFDNHRPFAYALWNDDYTDERPQDPFQNYSYDTQYFGLGSRGSLIPNLDYWTEWVWEAGHSFGNGNFLRRDYVEAWGWDVGLEYHWNVRMRPRVMAEYMFASGDADRLLSPTNAAGGNRNGRKDSSFNSFGYRDSGMAAALVPSNLHIWKAGSSLAPFDEVEFLRDMELGTNWFLYHKHHERAAISDITAGQFQGFVGWEMDYFINWRIASDISWTIRWGMFFPGDAFQDQSARSFLFTGITWSF